MGVNKGGTEIIPQVFIVPARFDAEGGRRRLPSREGTPAGGTPMAMLKR
jgi:hypothetical protein